MTRIQFLEKEIENVNVKIIKVIEGAYNSGRLEDEGLVGYDSDQVKGLLFMKRELELELDNEYEEGEED